jgi:hypothetical protein
MKQVASRATCLPRVLVYMANRKQLPGSSLVSIGPQNRMNEQKLKITRQVPTDTLTEQTEPIGEKAKIISFCPGKYTSADVGTRGDN